MKTCRNCANYLCCACYACDYTKDKLPTIKEIEKLCRELGGWRKNETL